VIVSLTHAWVFVLRGVHTHARVLPVPAFGCLHMLGVTCACFLDARVGVNTHKLVLRGVHTLMRVCCACLLLNVFMCFVLPALVSLTRAWVYMLRRVHEHARVLRVPAFGPTLVSLTHAWVFVFRAVHAHALGVTCACPLLVYTRMRVCRVCVAACLLLCVCMCLMSPALVFLMHAWVYVLREVHTHTLTPCVRAFWVRAHA
jgi:hypothetical protein